MGKQKRDSGKPSGKQQKKDIEGKNGVICLFEEDIRLIYNALKQYKPKPDEELLHSATL